MGRATSLPVVTVGAGIAGRSLGRVLVERLS
jgi:hypothetical protein